MPTPAAGNLAALGIGGAVGIAATSGAAAGLGALGVSGLALTVGAGGAGVLAGGVVAYGVGDFAHNLIDENWGADISQHGVIGGDIHGLSAYSGTLYGGVFDGIGDSAVKTGQDFANIGKSIWNGISSIF